MKSLQKTVAELHRAFESCKKDKLQTSSGIQDLEIEIYLSSSSNNNTSSSNSKNENALLAVQKTKRRNETKLLPKKLQQIKTKYVANKSSGLYVECKINNIPTECLLDTGAMLSIHQSLGYYQSK